MAEKSKKPTPKRPKVMDVAKPGKSAPSASSRPIILGHKPPVQDPMVNEDNEMPSGESEEHKIDVKRVGQKVIAPLSPVEDLKQDKEEKDSASSETTEPSDVPGAVPDEPEEKEVTESEPSEAEEQDDDTEDSEPEADGETSEPEPEDEEPVEPEESADEATGKEPKGKKDSKDKGSSIVDTIAGEAAKNKDKKADKENEELQKRLAEIEKLVDEKKYFVPTSSTTKKERKTRWAVLLLAILLLVAGYLVIDAQLIKNDYWLPYHFFKEEKEQPESAATNTPPVSNNDAKEPQGVPAVVPSGWSAKEAKTMLLAFALPTDWTFDEHDENACTKGAWITVVPSSLTVGNAAQSAGNENFKKHNIDIRTKAVVDESCDDITDGEGIDGFAESSEQIKSGLFAGSWITLVGSESDTVKHVLVTPERYTSSSEKVEAESQTIKAGSKDWLISIRFDSGASAQTTDFQDIPRNKYLTTDLYKDTVKVLNTFEYSKNAL